MNFQHEKTRWNDVCTTQHRRASSHGTKTTIRDQRKTIDNWPDWVMMTNTNKNPNTSQYPVQKEYDDHRDKEERENENESFRCSSLDTRSAMFRLISQSIRILQHLSFITIIHILFVMNRISTALRMEIVVKHRSAQQQQQQQHPRPRRQRRLRVKISRLFKFSINYFSKINRKTEYLKPFQRLRPRLLT